MIRDVAAKVPWVPVLIFASIFMTPEARIDLGGFQLYPYRLALFATLPALMVRVGRRPIRFGWTDMFIAAVAVYMMIATSVHYEIDVAIKTGGANSFDLFAAYIVGRVYFRSAIDVRRFVYAVSPLVLGVGIIMMLESVSHRYLLRPFVGAITGHSPAAALNRMFEIRNGFLRATGPFMHPIPAGLFFGSLVPLLILSDLPKRRWLGLIGCFGGIFGWSSAGIASMFVGFGLCVYEIVQRRVKLGWFPLIAAVVSICFLIEFGTNSGILRFIIRYASFNPQTGYFRLAILEYGWADVMRHPWFGIGFYGEYVRPDWMRTASVDNFWLLQALRYGVPCMILYIMATVSAIWSIGRVPAEVQHGSLNGRRMAVGLCISVVVLYLMMLTVAPWAADLAWFTMMLGMCVGMTDRLPVRRQQSETFRDSR